jgi:DNA polymerase-1
MQAGGLMHGTGFHGETRALDRLARVRLQIDVPKGLQLADWDAPRPSPGQIAYAGGDSVVAHRMWPDLRDALKRKGRWAAYGLQRRAAPVVAAMGLVGIGFDRAEHARHVDTWSRELAAARRQYVKLTGRPPPSKPSEIRGWLAVVLSADELERWQRTKADKALSISKDNLLRLAHIESALPVLDIINREKLLSTFGAKLLAKLNPVTGRLHPSFNLAATKAGRFSASDRNFQQMPTSKRAPGFRKCFVAALGHVLVGCDFSQIELRALAEISGNRALRRAFAHGIDIHRSTAAGIAGIPLE